jgi:PadR family transcriptional regulator, regulatory protein PadR
METTLARDRTSAAIDVEDEKINAGLIRLYVLHRAGIEPVFTLGIIESLASRGLKVTPASISRILGALKKRGYLQSMTVSNGHSPTDYRITRRGRHVIVQSAEKLRKLF